LQQTLSVNDIYPQNTKLLFTQPNILYKFATEIRKIILKY